MKFEILAAAAQKDESLTAIVAELAARIGVHLGVLQVLLGDLAAEGLVALLENYRVLLEGYDLVGIAAGWIPWLIYLDRTIFTFYTVVYVPFVVMALAMTLGAILGPSNAAARRRRDGAIAFTVLMVAFLLAGWWFYPVWSGEVIPYDAWRLRMWFSTWV